MKKLFMFLLMACLVGGFANSANAQRKKTTSPTSTAPTSKPTPINSNGESEKIDNILNEIESYIVKCERINGKIQEAKKQLAVYSKRTGPSRYIEISASQKTKVEKLQNILQKLKNDYSSCLRSAKKGLDSLTYYSMTDSQSRRWHTLLDRYHQLPLPE